MMLTPTIKIVIGVVAVGFAAIVLSEYTAHVKADAQAAATIKAQETYQKTLQDQLAALEKTMADRDAKYTQDMAGLQQRFQQASSPQQIATLISSLMGLKQPITITTPPPTPSNPNPQPVAQVPLEDAPQAKQYIQACESCNLLLPKVQADLATREAEAKVAQQEIDSLKIERDAAITASKGGTVWQRFKHDGKLLAIGGGVAIVVACATGHCPK